MDNAESTAASDLRDQLRATARTFGPAASSLRLPSLTGMRLHSRKTLALGLAGVTAAAVTSFGLTASASQGAAAPTCRGHVATIVGTAGPNEIHGTRGADVIAGLSGNDDIEAGAGNDLVCGGRGNDEMEGKRGNDRLFGGRGFDKAEGDRGRDFCRAEIRESC